MVLKPIKQFGFCLLNFISGRHVDDLLRLSGLGLVSLLFCMETSPTKNRLLLNDFRQSGCVGIAALTLDPDDIIRLTLVRLC